MDEQLSDAQVASLVQLYIAYFNRAPESSGLNYHIVQVQADLAAGLTFDQAYDNRASNFYQSAIDLGVYSANMSTADFVETVYDNVLARPGVGGEAPTDAEVNYWVNMLQTGQVERGDLVQEFIDSIDFLQENGTEEQQAQADLAEALLNNRTEVGLYFSQPENSGGLTGIEAFYAGRDAIDSVTADPDSVAEAIEEIEDGAPDTAILTADVDNVVGTAGADSFNAGLNIAGQQTLQNFDTIEGGEGDDELDATLTGNVAPTIDGVEVLNIRGVGGSLSLANATGVEQVWSDRSQSALTVSAVANVVAIGATNTAAAYTLNYDGSVTFGADDTQAIVLDDATITLDAEIGGTDITSAANVSIASNGDANSLTVANSGGGDLLTSAAVQNLTITGEADLAVTNAITAGTVDASEASGSLNLTVADAATTNLADGVADRTVTLGSGDDTVDASGATLANSMFEGGEGVDTIGVDATSGTLVNDLITNVSGFETLDLVGLDQGVSAAVLANVGFTNLIATDATGAAALTALTSGTDLTLANTDGGADTIALGVQNAAAGSDDSFAFKTLGADGNDSTFNITINDVENVSVTTLDIDPDVFQTTTLAVTSNAVQNLAVDGDEAVVFDGSGIGTLESVDVSGVAVADAGAGDLTADITVGDGVSVAGSDGDDVITFGNEATVTGNAGADTFDVNSDGTSTEFGTIADFEEDDIIDFAQDVTGINEISEADLNLAPGVDATFADYVAAATDTFAPASVADAEVSYFTFLGNTYLVQADDTTGADGFQAGEDQIVKIVGTPDLSDLAVDANFNLHIA